MWATRGDAKPIAGGQSLVPMLALRLAVFEHLVDLGRIEQNVLVVTAGADHIVPRRDTLPILDLVSSEDVTHFDRPGGHIGLMAGSKAREEIWPDIVEWLDTRSER